MLAESAQMIFSTAQKTGTVHLHNSAKDTPYGLKGACGSSIARPDAYTGNAWEAARERGTLGWCPRCKAKWPDTLAELIDP